MAIASVQPLILRTVESLIVLAFACSQGRFTALSLEGLIALGGGADDGGRHGKVHA